MSVGYRVPAAIRPQRAVHIVELGSALDAVDVADGLAAPTWSPAPVASQTLVTAALVEEIRFRVRAVE